MYTNIRSTSTTHESFHVPSFFIHLPIDTIYSLCKVRFSYSSKVYVLVLFLRSSNHRPQKKVPQIPYGVRFDGVLPRYCQKMPHHDGIGRCCGNYAMVFGGEDKQTYTCITILYAVFEVYVCLSSPPSLKKLPQVKVRAFLH